MKQELKEGSGPGFPGARYQGEGSVGNSLSNGGLWEDQAEATCLELHLREDNRMYLG